MLVIKNLTKSYGDFKAVDNLSLNVDKGTIYGFIGHNGAGKTTTLKAIAGIMPFDNGEIYIDSISVLNDPLLCKRKISYIPDNPDLYEYLTGLQYLNFISDIYHISADKRTELIHQYADIFEITDNLSSNIRSYSHGMKQKLAIISAFIHNPDLIIMDEPFVGLDPKASRELKELMKEHCAKGGSIFFSTHVLEVAEKLCDYIAIIKQGKLVISGKTKDVTVNDSLEDVFMELVNENS